MVTTRHAGPADENAVLDLWQHAGGPTRLAPSATALRRLVERDPEALLVAEVDGRLAGTLVVGWDGWRCHLYGQRPWAPDGSMPWSGTATSPPRRRPP